MHINLLPTSGAGTSLWVVAALDREQPPTNIQSYVSTRISAHLFRRQTYDIFAFMPNFSFEKKLALAMGSNTLLAPCQGV